MNLIINYFLLLATAKICAVAAKRARLWLAASAGAIYAVLAALPPAAWLAHPLMKLLSGALLLLAAFGARRSFARLALVFFAVSAAAAGAVMAAGARVNLRVLAAAFLVCYAAVTLVFRRAARAAPKPADVTIRVAAREVALRALRDTGNSLTDPLSGSAVCVVALDDALPLFPKELRGELTRAVLGAAPDGLIALNTLQSDVKFRLIPYSAVGVAGGALLGFRPEYIGVDGAARRDIVVAISPNAVSDNITYSALI
jgi:stage II sporulation protein GA (sporulation sigma-E factor processing peptidase)